MYKYIYKFLYRGFIMKGDAKFLQFIETIGFNQYPDYYSNFNSLPVGQEFIIPSYQNNTQEFKTKNGEDYCLSRREVKKNYNIFIKNNSGFCYSQKVIRKSNVIMNSIQQISKSSMSNQFNKRQISEKLLLFPIKYNYNMSVAELKSIEVGDIVVVNSFWENIHKNFTEFYKEFTSSKPHFICGQVVEIQGNIFLGNKTFKIQTSKTENNFFDIGINLADIFNFGSSNYNSIYRLQKISKSGQVKFKTYSNTDFSKFYNTELI